MEKKKTDKNIDKFNEITQTLPEFTDNFFYSGMTNKSILTALAYALDLQYFFQFAINNYAYFPEKNLKEITLDDISKITPVDIDTFTRWMRENQKLSDRTRARRRSSVSALYEYLVNTERKLSYNPVVKSTKIEIDEPEYVTYLNFQQQDILLDCITNGTHLTKKQLETHNAVKTRDRAIVFLFLDSGLRVSELASLNIGDVVFEENIMDSSENQNYVYTLRKGKKQHSKKPSKVFFSEESKEYITEYLEERAGNGEKLKDGSPLFITGEGNRLTVRGIQDMVKKYVKAALGRSDISVHKLRSSFAMEFYKSEKNLLVLQERMGHKSMAATNIYAKASDKEEAVIASQNWRQSRHT
ncbi:MAG: tyrosine-type recombinase/integrase [Butyrivibrio sp.]|nr:tyrosine-type recombinase/integrase [Butyrivibrio sp.]